MEAREFQFTPRHEWIWKGRSFGIVVSCHTYNDIEWTWCLYALIYDNHPLFTNVEAAIDHLPWHVECTFDRRITEEPARGIRYDFERKSELLKIGADYAHLYDDRFQARHPSKGIPDGVLADAHRLFDELRARAEAGKGEA